VSRRRGLAVGELLMGVLAVLAAFWCWHQGLHTSDYPPYTKGVDVQPITYYSGPWVSGAIGCVALAGLLVVDALRRSRE